MPKAIVMDDVPDWVKIEPCTYPLCPMKNMISLNCKGCTSEERRKIREEQDKQEWVNIIHLLKPKTEGS